MCFLKCVAFFTLFLAGSRAQSITVFQPVGLGASLAHLSSLSALPDPSSIPLEDRVRTLDPHAADEARRGLPVGLSGVGGFVKWINGSVGGVGCGRVRGVDGWEPEGAGSVGMVCELLAEGESGGVVGVEVWVEGGSGVQRVVGEDVVRYDDLSSPIVEEVVSKVGSGTNGGPTLSNAASFGRSMCWVGGDEAGAVLVGAPYDNTAFSNAGAVYLMRLDGDGVASEVTKTASGVNGGPTLGTNRYFGSSVSWLGDVDGDGEAWEVVVGAEEASPLTGSVYVMSLRVGEAARVLSRITDNTDGGPDLDGDGRFGVSVSCLGDVDGDGRAFDIAVGANMDDTGGTGRGAVYVLSINADGHSVLLAKITHGNGVTGPVLVDDDRFGVSVSAVWGWDGWEGEDGGMLAIGAHFDDTGDTDTGAVHLIHVGSDGSVSVEGKVASGTGGGPTLDAGDTFGISVCTIGDIDGDGVTVEMLVGARYDDTGGTGRGAVYVLSVNASSWDVNWWRHIASEVGGGPLLTNGDGFGISTAFVGDLSGLGRPHSITVGAYQDDTGGSNRGAIHVLSLSDITSASSSPSILASHPLPSTTSIATSSLTIPPTFPSTSLPHLDPHATDPSRRILPLSILTTTFNASHNLRLLNATIDSRACDSVHFIPNWPLSNNSRRIGVACVGVPEGESGKVVGGEVWVEDVVASSTYSISSASVSRYDDLSTPIVHKTWKIGDDVGGGPSLPNGARFGTSLCWIGGGVENVLMVGAIFEGEVNANEGAVYVMQVDEKGSASDVTRIASGVNGGPTLGENHRFGSSMAWLGDVDGDGDAWDVMIGAEEVTLLTGSVYVMHVSLADDARVLSRITDSADGGPDLDTDARFGSSIAVLGDVDGDGREFDVAIGSQVDDTEGANRGKVYIMSILPDGRGVFLTSISSGNGLSGPLLTNGDHFGVSLTAMWGWSGWREESGVILAVGAYLDDSSGATDSGAVHFVQVESNGTVSVKGKIASETGGGPLLADSSYFGISVACIGDGDGDGGSVEMVVGAFGGGSSSHGALYYLSVEATSWEVRWWRVVGEMEMDGGPALIAGDNFGYSTAFVGDFTNTGRLHSIAVGARHDNGNGGNRGAIYLLSLSDLFDSASAPSILAAEPATNQTRPLFPRASVPSLPPHMNDSSRQTLSLSILTTTFNASYNLRVLNASIDGRACDAVEVIDTWPKSTNSRRIGVACVGVPEGESGKVVGGEVWVEEVDGERVYQVKSGGVVAYADLMRPMVQLLTTFESEAEGIPTLQSNDQFGGSVASIGDIDDDGIEDVAISSILGDGGEGELNCGAVYITSLSVNGNARWTQKISSKIGGGPDLNSEDWFGSSLAWIGDLDGDGVFSDIVIGSSADDTGGLNRGAVFVCFLYRNGTVKEYTKIAHNTGGGPPLENSDLFGHAAVNVGDINGDGVFSDIAVGAFRDGINQGALYLMALAQNGTLLDWSKIGSSLNGGPPLAVSDRFAGALASLGKVDVGWDLASGAAYDNTGGDNRGAVYVLQVGEDWKVGNWVKIAHEMGGGPSLEDEDYFGYSLSRIGDADGDGLNFDLAVGAFQDNSGGVTRGAVYVLCLNTERVAHRVVKIASQISGGPILTNGDRFGNSIGMFSMMRKDGFRSVAVGAYTDGEGAVYFFKLANTFSTSTPAHIFGIGAVLQQPQSHPSASSFLLTSSPPFTFPQLEPLGTEPPSSLPLVIVSDFGDAISTFQVHEIRIGDKPCGSASVLPNWPPPSPTLRQVGVLCERIPQGVENSVVDIEVTYQTPSSQSLQTITASKLAHYGPCPSLQPNYTSLTFLPAAPPSLHPQGGTRLRIQASSFTRFNLSAASLSNSTLQYSCGATWEEKDVKMFRDHETIPSSFDARKVLFGIWVGGRGCLERRWVDEETVECVAPPGLGQNLSVVVGILGEFGIVGNVGYEDNVGNVTVVDVSPTMDLETDGSTELSINTSHPSLIPSLFKPVSVVIGGIFSVSITEDLLSPTSKYPTPRGIGVNLSVVVCVQDTHTSFPTTLPPTTYPSPSPVYCTSSSPSTPTISYKPPSLISVSPNADIDFLGGVTLTLTGLRFGDPEVLDVAGVEVVVWLGSKKCLKVEHVSDSIVTCVTPSLSGTSVRASVSIRGATSRETITLALLTVSLVSISPPKVMPAAQGVLSLDFSVLVFGAAEVTRLFIGGVECVDFEVIAEDSILCSQLPVPTVWETDDAWLFIKTSASSVSRRALLRTEPPPTILSVNSGPNGFPTSGGETINIIGTGFGLSTSDFEAVIVGGSEEAARRAYEEGGSGEVATSDEAVVLRQANTLANLSTISTGVTALLPIGCGGNVPVRVVTTWQLFSDPFTITYAPPTLSSTSLPTSPLQPALLLPGLENAVVDVCGRNMAPRSEDIDAIVIGGIKCMEMARLSSACIRCLSLSTPGSNSSSSSSSSPSNAISSWPNEAVRVVIRGQSSLDTLGLATFVPTPKLNDITPPTASPGDAITLLGEGMGEEAGYVVGVWVGGEENGVVATLNESVFVSDVTYVSQSQISFTLPPGVGTDIPVRFVTSTSLSSNSRFISYRSPTPRSINPASLLPGATNLPIALCGLDFPPRAEDVDGVWVGGKQCRDVEVVKEGCVNCVVDTIVQGEGWVREEKILVRGLSQPPTITSLATYVPLPSIESVSPQVAAPGDVITVDGVGFGLGIEDIGKVEVGGEECEGVVWVSGTRIRCTIPDPHPIWTAAEEDDALIVPLVHVIVELRSGMESVAIVEDSNGFVPGGDVRVRPDPAEAPWGVVAWRQVGNSGSMTVRWRFPGPALEARRVLERMKDGVMEGVVTEFEIEVGLSEEFSTSDSARKVFEFARDASIDRTSDLTETDPTIESAWETHEEQLAVATSSPLFARIRSVNDDGFSNWTLAHDPDPRQGLLVNDGAQIPETCQQDAYLKTHRSEISEMTCGSCPLGAVCGGLGAANITGIKGYWRVPWSSDALGFAPCDTQTACLGHNGALQSTTSSSTTTSTTSTSNTSIANSVVLAWKSQDESDRSVALSNLHLIPSDHEGCAKGHRGVLCSACATGFFPGVGGSCTACGNRGWIAGRFVLLTIAILIALTIVIIRAYQTRMAASSKEVQIMKIIFTHLQTVAIVGGVQLRWPVAARGFFDTVDAGSSFATSGLALECLMGDSSSNPFLRTILILIIPFFLAIYILFFWGTFGVLEQRIAGCQHCIRGMRHQSIASTPSQEELPTTTAPSTITDSSTRKRRASSIPQGSSQWKERVILSLVVLAFLVHTPLTSAAFRLLTCKPVYAEGDSGNFQLRLVMDLDVRCATRENLAAIIGIAAPMVLFIALGLPIGVGLVLRTIGPDGLQSVRWRQRLGFLTNGYRGRRYYWECVVLLRKVFLAFTTTTLAPTGGGMQVTMALLVVLLAMALHARAQPYTSKPINLLEGMALVTSAVTLVCGQFVTLDEVGATGTASGYVGVAASIFLITINAMFFLVALVLLSQRAREAIATSIQNMQNRIGMSGESAGERSSRQRSSLLDSFRNISPRSHATSTTSPATATTPIAMENPMMVTAAKR